MMCLTKCPATITCRARAHTHTHTHSGERERERERERETRERGERERETRERERLQNKGISYTEPHEPPPPPPAPDPPRIIHHRARSVSNLFMADLPSQPVTKLNYPLGAQCHRHSGELITHNSTKAFARRSRVSSYTATLLAGSGGGPSPKR